jgi:hypothetical protein
VAAVYVTRRSTIKRAEDVQQGTLACPGLAHDGQHFALAYAERQILKEHQVGCAGTKDLLEAFYPEQIGLLNLMQPASPASHF